MFPTHYCNIYQEGINIPTHVNGEEQAALKRAIDESFVRSFRLVALISAALALVSAFSAWLLIEGKPGGQAGSAAKGSQVPTVGADEEHKKTERA